MNDANFAHAISSHDQLLTSRDITVWCGTEPTFTDRFSEAPEWTNAALGGRKAERAEALLALLGREWQGIALRTVGRQYPEEDRPRWNLGIYQRRAGDTHWQGPPDPSALHLATSAPPPLQLSPETLRQFQSQLSTQLRQRYPQVKAFNGIDGSLRVWYALKADDTQPTPDPEALSRHSVHAQKIPLQGLHDDLAKQGIGLLILDRIETHFGTSPRLELPALDTAADFLELLSLIERAAIDAGLESLILAGYPPPVDASVAWTTITPDPAVIEINMAPYPSVSDLLHAKRALYKATASLGLAPYRLHYNGDVADSGGAGQITLGGPSPEESPFLREPQLLPRLIRYCNQHPALSYLFSHDYVGGSGQAVRADERGTDAFAELELALALLARETDPTPKRVWTGLAQFMTDSCGNSHRAELNIEKLWNALLPDRGMQGLVEFRAMRMQHSPERAAALAALLRAVIARLTTTAFDDSLIEWGTTLHQRFALPYYLQQDLQRILQDLDSHGFGLAAPIVDQLTDNRSREWVHIDHKGCRLHIHRALEFWPLVGDVGSQSMGDSRLIDSSTARLEFQLRPSAADTAGFERWQLTIDDYRIPLRREHDPMGPLLIFGLRYTSFVPWLGLHPSLTASDPLRLTLSHPDLSDALQIELYHWRPDHAPYDGLPKDLAEAQLRRAQRCLTRQCARPEPDAVRSPPAVACSDYLLDLRWL